MTGFILVLQDATRSEQIEGVISFVGEDASGSFGILTNHARMTTTLVMGMARFCTEPKRWRYLALPGGVLYFRDNRLTLSTRHYLLDDNYEHISNALRRQILTEEETLHSTKTSLHQMEEEILKRLWQTGREGTP